MKRSPVLNSANPSLLKPKRGIQTAPTHPSLLGLGFGEIFFFFFLAVLLSDFWDLSSLTKDRTCAPSNGGVESQYWTTREIQRWGRDF